MGVGSGGWVGERVCICACVSSLTAVVAQEVFVSAAA